MSAPPVRGRTNRERKMTVEEVRAAISARTIAIALAGRTSTCARGSCREHRLAIKEGRTELPGRLLAIFYPGIAIFGPRVAIQERGSERP